MMVQVLLLAFCAVAHGAPNGLSGVFSAQGPPTKYDAPAPSSPFPPSPPSQFNFSPGAPAPVEPSSPAPAPGQSAPAPQLISKQPEDPTGFSAPTSSGSSEEQEVPLFEQPQLSPLQSALDDPFQEFGAKIPPGKPSQDYSAPALAPAPVPAPAPAPAPKPAPKPAPAPAPVQPATSYGAPALAPAFKTAPAPAPVQPETSYGAPAPAPAPSPAPAPTFKPAPAPAPVQSATSYDTPVPAPAPAPAPKPAPSPAAKPAPVQPATSYVAPSHLPPGKPAEGTQESSEESAESSEESTGLTDHVVNLSSAQTIEGKTLSDSKIQSILTAEVNSLGSGGPSHVETGPTGGYSNNAPPKSCQAGETLNSNGVCEKVKSSTNYYLFDVPEAPKQPLTPTQTSEKKVHYNVLLVRVPTESQQIQNINLSKDEQKTLVYVVRDPPKGSSNLPAPVTEAYKPVAPAVFYVTPAAKAAPPEGKDPEANTASSEEKYPGANAASSKEKNPATNAASSEEEGQAGYGNVSKEKETMPAPPSPSKGYGYNPPAAA